jgi:hypothetical protein
MDRHISLVHQLLLVISVTRDVHVGEIVSEGDVLNRLIA